MCGRVIGYQYARPDAFTIPDGFRNPGNRDVSIDSSYVDGVSITYGAPRKHLWTYAGGLTEQSALEWNSPYSCPCTNNYTGPGTQAFVGDNYYCESANKNETHYFDGIYLDDKLWDGQQCSGEGDCCSRAGLSPPWFNVEVSSGPVSDDIEVRICGDEGTANEGTPLELVELYVQ